MLFRAHVGLKAHPVLVNLTFSLPITVKSIHIGLLNVICRTDLALNLKNNRTPGLPNGQNCKPKNYCIILLSPTVSFARSVAVL